MEPLFTFHRTQFNTMTSAVGRVPVIEEHRVAVVTSNVISSFRVTSLSPRHKANAAPHVVSQREKTVH